jgi:transcriptional regulator of arginine metabolism
MTKGARHYAIREILGRATITNQEDLRLLLRRRGFRVTQATLSRDMKELGVARVVSGGKTVYAIQPTGGSRLLRPIVGAEVLSIEANECVIVVRTVPGAAGTVGEYIDVQNDGAILGTVAGDNTLMVIPRSTRNIKQVLGTLKHTLIEEHE